MILISISQRKFPVGILSAMVHKMHIYRHMHTVCIYAYALLFAARFPSQPSIRLSFNLIVDGCDRIIAPVTDLHLSRLAAVPRRSKPIHSTITNPSPARPPPQSRENHYNRPADLPRPENKADTPPRPKNPNMKISDFQPRDVARRSD